MALKNLCRLTNSCTLKRLRDASAVSICLLATFPGAAAPTVRTSHAAHRARPRVVGYFPQWGIYNEKPYYVKNLEVSGGAALLDQMNYAQGFVTGGHCSVADPNADLNLRFTAKTSVNGRDDGEKRVLRGNFHQLQELKRRHPRLKILISLEGKASSFESDAEPENRVAFVRSCVDIFLRGRFAPGAVAPGLFDGIDVDWEYPHAENADDFIALLKEFRRQMDALRPGFTLTIAVGPSPHMYPGTDMAEVSRVVDQVGVMNYDYAGPWNQRTGLLAPLFAEKGGSIDRSVTEYAAAGVPKDKMLMGLPFYGYGWNGVQNTNNGLFQEGHGVHGGDQPYTFIQSLGGKFAPYRDRRSQAPWLYDGATFWTFEDAVSVRYKMNYARAQGLGGVMIWELSGDTSRALLLRTARRTLDHPDPKWELPPQETGVGTSADSAGARGRQ